MAPTMMPTAVGRPLDVLLLAAENENDNLPWLRTQSRDVEQECYMIEWL